MVKIWIFYVKFSNKIYFIEIYFEIIFTSLRGNFIKIIGKSPLLVKTFICFFAGTCSTYTKTSIFLGPVTQSLLIQHQRVFLTNGHIFLIHIFITLIKMFLDNFQKRSEIKETNGVPSSIPGVLLGRSLLETGPYCIQSWFIVETAH